MVELELPDGLVQLEVIARGVMGHEPRTEVEVRVDALADAAGCALAARPGAEGGLLVVLLALGLARRRVASR